MGFLVLSFVVSAVVSVTSANKAYKIRQKRDEIRQKREAQEDFNEKLTLAIISGIFTIVCAFIALNK
ncbi:MAG: hypothetical protein HC815_37310 [Richelia sp. RM1_1_1]|nr:hypothetical protein [Richelia sp. RM1_1_1]